MRIRFLLMNAYAIGGTVRATLDTASALARRGHDVDITTVFRHRLHPRFPFDPAVPVRALVPLGAEDEDPADDLPGDLDAYRRIEEETRRRHGVDDLAAEPSRLIHPRDSKHSRFSLLTDARLEAFLRSIEDGVLVGTRPGLNLAIARWGRPGVLCVGQEHVHSQHHHRSLRQAMAIHYPKLDALTALTQRDVTALQELVDDRVPVHWMPDATPELPQRDVDLDRRIVVAGGRITPAKGFDLLVAAWEQVVPHHPDWRLRIFGHGPDFDELRAQVDASPAASSIELPGVTPDLSAKLPDGSIFVLSSRLEGFGLVLLEAMGHGLPVISFDCPHGPGEIIDHEADGLLVPAEDVDAMAATIRRLIGDPAERYRLGAAAERKAGSFSPDALADRWEQLLEGAPRRPGRVRRFRFGRPGW